MSQGWVKFHRELLHTCIADNQDALTVYFHLMLTVNHKAARVTFPNCIEPIDLLPGQTVTSLPVLASKAFKKRTYNDGINGVRRAFTLLEKFSMISVKATNRFSIVTIVDWDTCKQEEVEVYKQNTNGLHADNKQITTNKNENTEKNGENTAGAVPIPEPLASHDGFKDAWSRWLRHRKGQLTAETKKSQLGKAVRRGAQWTIEAIDHSIANGWSGVWHPDGGKLVDALRDDGTPITPPRPWKPKEGASQAKGKVFLSAQFAFEAIAAKRVTKFNGQPIPDGLGYNSDGLCFGLGQVWLTTEQLKTAEFE